MTLAIKKFLPRTLFGRSLLILAAPILLIQIITTFVFFDSHWSKMTARLAFAVAGEIAVIAGQIEAGQPPDDIKTVTAWAGQYLELLVSYEPDGALQTLGKTSHRGLRNYDIANTLAMAMDAQVRRPYHVNVDSREKWVEVSVQLAGGLLRVSVPQRRLFSSSVFVLLRWMIATSIVLLIVAVLFMRNQIRPIRRLAVVAERFGKGMDPPTSFKPEGAREVRQAAHAFLDMQERIKRQIQQRTAMLAGVSHDLRTPLTRMKLQAAMLSDSPDVQALKSDIVAMERMIDAYLNFARGEGGEQTTRTDLNAILERLVAGVRRQSGTIELETEGDLSLQIRPVAFERALGNIINNARQYAKHIWVTARKIDNEVEIVVEDDGPGIPEDKRDDVFRPFYRIESSRNPATGGVGLGLPIAQDIVHGHGGEIALDNSTRGGLRVIIRVPV